MRYVLGIDQGGSKTLAAVANELGEVLGVGRGAGACHAVCSLEKAMQPVLESTHAACAAAGIALSDISLVAAGMTGVDWSFEAQLLRGALASSLHIPERRITVVNDCLIALRAGSASPSGCILCAGSGLNCGVRRDENHEYAFGYYIDDRCQGGQALGNRVLQTVFDAEAGLTAQTALTNAVLAYMDCPTVDELLYRRVNAQLDGKKVLHLPRVLETTALAGDAVALELLRTFGADIARYAVAGLRRFDMLDDAVDVVLSGSVFKCRARALQDSVTAVIRDAAPHARIMESRYEPIVGAVLTALDQWGATAEEAVHARIERDAQRLGLIRSPEE